jgi:F-box/WD-40 domain protein 10
VYPGSYDCILNRQQSEPKDLKKLEHNWQTAYIGYSTRNIIMEERNVFCGPYNVLLLKEKRDAHRVIHFDGKSTVAYGSFDKKIRIIDLKSAIERNTSIQGHAGSIKCIYVCESKRMLITGSYDCSIRCWSIATGKCLRIFQGHQQTVTCLTMHDALERIISGSTDKTCKSKSEQATKQASFNIFIPSYHFYSLAVGQKEVLENVQTHVRNSVRGHERGALCNRRR